MSLENTENVRPLQPAVSDDTGLGSSIDWGLLARLGYDPTTAVFAPDAADPVFGYVECKAAACDQVARTRLGLCGRCDQLWKKAGPQTNFRAFCGSAPGPLRQRRIATVLCAVCRTPGHERPVRAHGLCAACEAAMAKRGQSAEEYVDGDGEFPAATPRPSFGRCEVATCTRFAWRARPALCGPHHSSWRGAGRPTGRAMQAWSARQHSIDRDSRVVVLYGLGERARLEVLYGVQRAVEVGRRTKAMDVQTAVNILRAQGVDSVSKLSIEQITPATQPLRFLTFVADQVALALATPASEAAKDDWDLRVFGHIPGLLRFGVIRQSWLRETAKAWTAERIDTVETPRAFQAVLRAVRALSESLTRHRPDGGADPSLLSRADLAAFANDLAHLEARGDLSRNTRRGWVTEVDRFLRQGRAMGLSRPGGPMHGLPETAVLGPAHVPSVSREEQGRALPQAVLDQLLDQAALGALEASFGAERRAMVELAARVGRRTGEICGLRLECLAFEELADEAGRLRHAPVLVHDMPKVGVVGYRLPIDAETAEIIRAQQARARARYPDSPSAPLALFPTVVMNPRGTKGCNVSTFEAHFRAWVNGLPELTGEGGEPYDRSAVTIYSFRHSFAQRHADSGTPIEVLAELMGHTRLTSTQTYYRVTEKRKRKAVDLLAGLQVDRDGTLPPPRRASPRRRNDPRGHRTGRCPLRRVQRTDQCESARTGLPVPPPVLRLHLLPQRPELPARAARLPHPAPGRQRAAPGGTARARGLGPQRRHPLSGGDRLAAADHRPLRNPRRQSRRR